MRILVTGASGFVGSHVVDVLAEAGDEVHAVGFRNAGPRARCVTWHSVDLLQDRFGMRSLLAEVRPTHLIHTAWTSTPGTYQTDRANFDWVTASIDLASAFAESGGKRFTGAGTCAEYDLRFGFMTEGLTPLAPSTPYAIAKDAARRVLESLCSANGVAFAWGRIFSLYGPREHPRRLAASVAGDLLSGRTADVSEGLQIRDFLHVRDVAAGLVAIAKSELGGAVNVSSGKPVSVREFVTTLAAAMGSPDRVSFGARPLHTWEPPFLVGDNTILRSTGWAPTFDLRNGVAHAAAWWREHS